VQTEVSFSGADIRAAASKFACYRYFNQFLLSAKLCAAEDLSLAAQARIQKEHQVWLDRYVNRHTDAMYLFILPGLIFARLFPSA
jgi:hypothetical protein